MSRIIRNKDKFYKEIPFAYSVTDFANSNSEYHWWFDKCILDGDDSYVIFFKSYMTPEYKDFLLVVRATKVGDSYDFKITKKVTTLSSN